MMRSVLALAGIAFLVGACGGGSASSSSTTYQAALPGPCESLAPAGWVSSGLVTQGGGS